MSWKINWNAATALFSMLVAICALGASLWQGYLLQAHNRLSVTPALEFERNIDPDEQSFSVYLNNNGIGPGRVLNSRLRIDGKTYDTWPEIFTALKLDSSCFGHGAIDRLYKIGDRQLVIRNMERPECRMNLETATAMFSRVSLDLEYESLYHDQYRLSGSLL